MLETEEFLLVFDSIVCDPDHGEGGARHQKMQTSLIFAPIECPVEGYRGLGVLSLLAREVCYSDRGKPAQSAEQVEQVIH